MIGCRLVGRVRERDEDVLHSTSVETSEGLVRETPRFSVDTGGKGEGRSLQGCFAGVRQRWDSQNASSVLDRP